MEFFDVLEYITCNIINKSKYMQVESCVEDLAVMNRWLKQIMNRALSLNNMFIFNFRVYKRHLVVHSTNMVFQ